jgi:hypothetical protein
MFSSFLPIFSRSQAMYEVNEMVVQEVRDWSRKEPREDGEFLFFDGEFM